DSGTSYNSYYHATYGTITVNFEDWGYKWDSMSLSSSDIYNSLLLYHCSVAVDMNFGPDGSSAYTSKSKPALSSYFSVSKKTAYKARRLYESTWNDMLVEELMKGRPIIYAGDGGEGSVGHAFNIDGVVEGKYFHINWGWSGSQNGFFLLDGLTPGSSDFTQNQTALLGIQPYYYPTDIILSNYIVPEDVDPGASIGGIMVIDEAIDNEYLFSLVTDSTFIEGAWVHDYFVEGDTLRTGRFFSAGEAIRDTVWIKVKDRYNNLIEKELYLTFETTTGNQDTYYNDRLQAFVIYPNPAGNYFSVKDDNSIPVTCIRLFNLSGQMVRYIPASGLDGFISIEGITRGVYIIEATYDDGFVIRKKLIRQ
ncbi:MAG: T9SS type A sorting domain-containing protein, partial [Bacteroidia bacterium]